MAGLTVSCTVAVPWPAPSSRMPMPLDALPAANIAAAGRPGAAGTAGAAGPAAAAGRPERQAGPERQARRSGLASSAGGPERQARRERPGEPCWRAGPTEPARGRDRADIRSSPSSRGYSPVTLRRLRGTGRGPVRPGSGPVRPGQELCPPVRHRVAIRTLRLAHALLPAAGHHPERPDVHRSA